MENLFKYVSVEVYLKVSTDYNDWQPIRWSEEGKPVDR